jgi:hypothetical protein
MSEAVLDVVTGLVAAGVSGTAVWVWQRGRGVRTRRGKAAFFGLRPGRDCLVVMNRHWRSPNAVARSDVYALLEVGSLADELGCTVSVQSSDELREGVGDRTEFCIGGPDSNARAAAHLVAFVPGVTFRPYSDAREPLGIVVGDQRFVREPDKREYALVAKFRPPNAANPVFLICGQTAITNRAAIHFVKDQYSTLRRSLASVDRFSLIVRVTAPDVYGHKMVELQEDVTATAFAPGTTAVVDNRP